LADPLFPARWNSTIKARFVQCGTKPHNSRGKANGCPETAQLMNGGQERLSNPDFRQIRI
jgi:hypothetical protein